MPLLIMRLVRLNRKIVVVIELRLVHFELVAFEGLSLVSF